MGTTDANGIYIYDMTDQVTPLATSLNLLASSVSDVAGGLREDVDDKQPLLTDTGWLSSGYTAASGVAVSSFSIRRIGNMVQVRCVANATYSGVTTSGDCGNTTWLTLDPQFRPAQIGSLSSSGVGRCAEGIVLTDGQLQVAAFAADATQTGTQTYSGLTLSLGGVYFL